MPTFFYYSLHELAPDFPPKHDLLHVLGLLVTVWMVLQSQAVVVC